MDIPTISALADAGGWAVVLVMGAAIGIGAIRGWWVPGYAYRREVDRGDNQDVAIAKLTDALLTEARRSAGRRRPPANGSS